MGIQLQLWSVTTWEVCCAQIPEMADTVGVARALTSNLLLFGLGQPRLSGRGGGALDRGLSPLPARHMYGCSGEAPGGVRMPRLLPRSVFEGRASPGPGRTWVGSEMSVCSDGRMGVGEGRRPPLPLPAFSVAQSARVE